MSDPIDPSRRAVLIATAACALAPLRGVAVPDRQFRVFDALLYLRKPDLKQFGITSLPTLYQLWRQGSPHNVVDVPAMHAALAQLPSNTDLFFIDIEYWPLLQVADAVLNSSVANFMEVASIVRAAKPGVQYGFYNVAPVGVYWAILMQKSPEYANWLRVNRALDPLGAQVDAMFPSLYTFYDDQPGWMTAAEGLLSEARRYGKPVYPFLWPEYHDSNVKLAGQYIPTEFWNAQLQFCRQHADGVVLWGGYQRLWKSNAAWWKATIQTLQLASSS